MGALGFVSAQAHSASTARTSGKRTAGNYFSPAVSLRSVGSEYVPGWRRYALLIQIDRTHAVPVAIRPDRVLAERGLELVDELVDLLVQGRCGRRHETGHDVIERASETRACPLRCLGG